MEATADGQIIAVITDEFGAVQGLVTLIDVMEAIVGDLPSPGQRNQPEAKRREEAAATAAQVTRPPWTLMPPESAGCNWQASARP